MKKKPGKPAKKKAPASTGPVSDVIRQVIRSRGLTAYATAKLSGVSIDPVQHFLNGTRGLTLATVDKLCKGLGLVLVEAGSPSARVADPRRAF
jgi:plasmid maintenance system antidote protein VapI